MGLQNHRVWKSNTHKNDQTAKCENVRRYYYYIVHLYSPSNNKVVPIAQDAYSNRTGMFSRCI